MSRGKKYGLNRDVSRSSTCMHLLLSRTSLHRFHPSTDPEVVLFPTISSFAEIGWRSRKKERERVNVRVWTTRGYIECAATEATGKRWTRGNFHPRRDYFFFAKIGKKRSFFAISSRAAEWRRSCLPLRLMNALKKFSSLCSAILQCFSLFFYHFSVIKNSLWCHSGLNPFTLFLPCSNIVFIHKAFTLSSTFLWLKMHFAVGISTSAYTYLYDFAAFDSSLLRVSNNQTWDWRSSFTLHSSSVDLLHT